MTKQTHLAYLKECGPFKLDCNRIIFSNEEIYCLEKYGHWFAALEDGTLEPFTERQRYFVEVCRGEKHPMSLEEFAWFKYKARKQIETEQGDSLYNTPVWKEHGFYTRQDVSKVRRSMGNENWKNHKQSQQL